MVTVCFAYGSNMDRAQMRERCPASRLLGHALLWGWRFRITRHGYATVVPEPGAVVHGVLWEVAPADEVALDAYEGVAEHLYAKVKLLAEPVSGPTVMAMVYLMNDEEPGEPLPGYLETVIAAAKGHYFPDEYCRELATWRID